jgi:two-component system response regulator GlrR
MMIPRPKILLVDDDPSLLDLLSLRLNAVGYDVSTAESGEQALARMSAASPHLLITDLKMNGMDGLALLEACQRRDPTLPVIILTAHGTIPEAVDATQKGAFSFLAKPFDGKTLEHHIHKALQLVGTAQSVGANPADDVWRRDIITRCPLMEELLRQAQRVAASGASVFIHGESGCGKELLAEAIYKAGSRSAKPFQVLNCSAIPETLLESELFGHRKGAFTGATASHPGLFQAADGGILFLDEIGDMPLNLQVKLLRALQDRSVRPVGSTESIPVDVQVISATHRDLEAAMGRGEFRQDLYYRLNVVMLEIPPLRKRREDIPLLASHFLAKVAARRADRPKRFSPDAMELLVNASWPGNVRQLSNLVEQTTLLTTSDIIPVKPVEGALRERPREFLAYSEAKSQFERSYLSRILRIADGNVSQAARLARRNRTEFYRLLRRHQLEPDRFRGKDE